MKIKALLNVLLLVFALAQPAWAATKTATVRVSCTIAPSLELTAKAFQPVQGQSNMDSRFQMSQDSRLRGGHKIDVYSITAL